MSDPTTPLPFQPATMTTAHLAAVSYLARYTGRTHILYAYQLCGSGSNGASPTGWTRWSGSSAPTSSCTSAGSATTA
jgi:hypothetical protein